MHAFGKITLFFCAGAFMVATHKTEVSQMRGLGRTMPFTMAAFLIGSLSIIGLPPMGGLWSKWYLALGALEAGEVWLVGVLMFSSLLNVAYLLPIPFRGFFSAPDGGSGGNGSVALKEAPLPCLIAIGITCIGCVLLFLFPDPVYNLLLPITGQTP
ncbi:MAG: monovalent cation/H+ antiporter subunit D family protein, partial [Rhodospirillales bacterium]|nr:monovalent cation/H+ antiporter subunit D family protein [Rhodospirillales bacterium]